MPLPTSFLEELRARTPLAAIVGRKVKLLRSGRNQRGCCPFHSEKSPSFYVYEDGFHCFGCGAHGDAISFVMQSEGTSFIEAVTRLAGEAGLDVPAPSPHAAAAEQHRVSVTDVLEKADALFRRLLHTPDGQAALAYLRARDLTDATIAQAGLGYAPSGRTTLLAALQQNGITSEQAVKAGLAQEGDHGTRPLFFDRVTFPIHDAKGRLISFGGRTLGDGQPKYLNGPESPVFSKRRTLYGLHVARAAARTGASILVVEGYMDVIRLQQAGFHGAVAPLGTALTEDQLALLWRLTPDPCLCFDGDAAGARAAGRSLELALPLLAPDQTLRIISLPDGEDPDSLVRTRGAPALQAAIEAAAPAVDALYIHLRGTLGTGPEAIQGFRDRLRARANEIRHKGLGDEYYWTWHRRLRDESFQRRPPRGTLRPTRILRPQPAPLRPTALPTAPERGRILTAILLNHPDLLHDVDEAYCRVDLPPALARLRTAMLDWTHSAASCASDAPIASQNTTPPLDSTHLIDHLTQIGLAAEAAQALSAVPLPACAATDAQPAEAEANWWHIFGLLDRGGLEAQVADAIRCFADLPTVDRQRRLIALCAARDALRMIDPADDAPPD